MGQCGFTFQVAISDVMISIQLLSTAIVTVNDFWINRIQTI